MNPELMRDYVHRIVLISHTPMPPGEREMEIRSLWHQAGKSNELSVTESTAVGEVAMTCLRLMSEVDVR